MQNKNKKIFIGFLVIILISISLTIDWNCIYEINKKYEKPPRNLIDLFSNVRDSEYYKYQAQDNLHHGLDCLNIIESTQGEYYGVHHSYNGTSFNVHLVSSNDLMNWSYVTLLAREASMPIIEKIPNSDGFILLHEQWQNPNCGSPCWIKAQYFENLLNLRAGIPNRTYQTEETLSNLEGTPNIYNISENGNKISIGFHYNSKNGADLVAKAILSNLIEGEISWETEKQEIYNRKLICRGADSHIGGRKYGKLFDFEFNLQEAMMDGSDWGSWRIWIYNWNDGGFSPLSIQTHGCSKSFTNPQFRVVSDPKNNSKEVIFISYFIQGTNAAESEAGELIFYQEIFL